MSVIGDYFRELNRATREGWNRFWFTPADPAALGLIRILAGAMLFYTHLIWSLDLQAFFGQRGWMSREALATLPGRDWAWSYLNWIHSPTLLWAAHIAALVVFLLLTLGLFSRTMAVLGFLIAVSYANRAPFALFGLDDINALLALYLAVGSCGAAYSLDRLWRRWRVGRGEARGESGAGDCPRLRSPRSKRGLSPSAHSRRARGERGRGLSPFAESAEQTGTIPLGAGPMGESQGGQGRSGTVPFCGVRGANGDCPPRRTKANSLAIEPRTDANIAIRLIQVHMCVIYLFAALGKLMGPAWWNGSATWESVANLEYQSLDMTWLAGWPILISLLTHATVWWELSYCVLIWPRLTRPIVLALAIPIHLGIAMFLGMQTFGWAMLIGNLAFVSPWLVRRLFDGRARPAEQGRAGGQPATAPLPAAHA